MESYEVSIIEGLLITLNEDRTVNLSPMGARFSTDKQMVLLRPFKTSRSYRNLAREAEAVFHVTDDAALIARAALNDVSVLPPMTPINETELCYLSDACRWHYLRLQSHDISDMRASFDMRVAKYGVIRDFIGFNRAKNALVEAAILASRVGILPDDQIRNHMEILQPAVEKTGDISEHEAFLYLKSRILEKIAAVKNSDNDCMTTESGNCDAMR